MTGARVTTAHMREANALRLGGHTWCVEGGRAWCARNGISWSEFVRHGIPVERVAAVGDAYSQHLVALATRPKSED